MPSREACSSRCRPGCDQEAFPRRPSESAVDFAVRIAGDLDETVLAIQGPPGSGKTYSGGEMICELIRQGKKVGVTARQPQGDPQPARRCWQGGRKAGVAVRLAHREATRTTMTARGSVCRRLGSNEDALDALQSGEANVVGGTAWLWARPEFVKAVDVLFVDEAGQMSLANVLAVVPRREKHRPAWRPAATRTAAEGEPPRGRERFGASAHPG